MSKSDRVAAMQTCLSLKMLDLSTQPDQINVTHVSSGVCVCVRVFHQSVASVSCETVEVREHLLVM